MNVIKYINFDIFTNILRYLDYESIKQFILTNKIIYNYYQNNKRCVSLIVIQKIDEKFCIRCLKKGDELAGKKIDNVSMTYNKVYNQFKRQKCINLTDIIVYLVENKYNGSIYMLKKLISNSELRVYDDNISMNVISHTDMIYLLVYSNVEELGLLLDKFTVPISILSYGVQEIVYNRKGDYRKKLYKLINYICYKYCYKKMEYMNNMYIHKILVYFIRTNEKNIIKYFLEKKRYYKNELTYQTLINECISYESIGCLNLLIREMEYDSKLLKIYITIDRAVIEKVVKKGSFYMIKYVIENLMGNFINMNGYITSICNGINHYNGGKFTRYIKKLKMLEGYFSNKSKSLINDCLESNVKNVSKIYLM